MVRPLRDGGYTIEGRAIMAGRATGRDARVVHWRAGAKGCRAQMTRRAIESCRYVVRRLACCCRAVVAAGTIASHACMIEAGGSPEADIAPMAGHAIG